MKSSREICESGAVRDLQVFRGEVLEQLRISLRHRYFNLTKQRHNLLRAKPLLRHEQLLSKLILSQRLV